MQLAIRRSTEPPGFDLVISVRMARTVVLLITASQRYSSVPSVCSSLARVLYICMYVFFLAIVCGFFCILYLVFIPKHVLYFFFL